MKHLHPHSHFFRWKAQGHSSIPAGTAEAWRGHAVYLPLCYVESPNSWPRRKHNDYKASTFLGQLFGGGGEILLFGVFFNVGEMVDFINTQQ